VRVTSGAHRDLATHVLEEPQGCFRVAYFGKWDRSLAPEDYGDGYFDAAHDENM